MTAFLRFDPWAVIERENPSGAPANPANPAKDVPRDTDGAPSFSNFRSFSRGASSISGAPGIEPFSSAGAPAQPSDSTAAPEPRTGAADDGVPEGWRPALDALAGAPAPAGWPAAAWADAVAGARDMLIAHGAELEACAWSDRELFALDALAPWHRTEGAGALRFLIGRRVTLVRRDVLALQVEGSTVIQRFPRPRPRADMVLPWSIEP